MLLIRNLSQNGLMIYQKPNKNKLDKNKARNENKQRNHNQVA